MVTTKRADQVAVGDIMSTNGARIEAAVLCQTIGHPEDDEVCIVYAFEGDGQRIEYVAPDRPVYIWTEES